jgi:hypothetical protein
MNSLAESSLMSFRELARSWVDGAKGDRIAAFGTFASYAVTTEWSKSRAVKLRRERSDSTW